MRLHELLMPGGPFAPASPGADASSAGQSDASLTLLLGVLFGIPMFVCFTLGVGHLIDWFRVCGWRPEHLRRKLK
jgi:hypothetical protein